MKENTNTIQTTTLKNRESLGDQNSQLVSLASLDIRDPSAGKNFIAAEDSDFVDVIGALDVQIERSSAEASADLHAVPILGQLRLDAEALCITLETAETLEDNSVDP